MAKARQRRERGEGAIFYSKARHRWVGQLDAGTNAAGTRLRPIVVGHIRDETLANYTSLLRGSIYTAIGDTRVTQLRAIDIETMLLGLQEAGRSARCMRLARNLTQRALDYAVRRDVVDRNVAAAVRSPSGPSAERYGLTRDTALRRSAQMPGHGRPARARRAGRVSGR